jgi:hypothetical protein
MASPDQQSSFEAFLLENSIEFSVVISNVEEYVLMCKMICLFYVLSFL